MEQHWRDILITSSSLKSLACLTAILSSSMICPGIVRCSWQRPFQTRTIQSSSQWWVSVRDVFNKAYQAVLYGQYFVQFDSIAQQRGGCHGNGGGFTNVFICQLFYLGGKVILLFQFCMKESYGGHLNRNTHVRGPPGSPKSSCCTQLCISKTNKAFSSNLWGIINLSTMLS